MKKVLKISGIVAGVLVLAAVLALGALYAAKWVVIKKEKVRLGFAEPNFPFRNYSIEELNKMYPQIKYADVQTRVTPEETYTRFRQALKDNNLEMAIEQLSKSSKKRYGENVKDLTDFYNQNEFQELYNNYYPEQIIKVNMHESIAQYEFNYYDSEYKKELIGTMDFTKDANGDWKMDSL